MAEVKTGVFAVISSDYHSQAFNLHALRPNTIMAIAQYGRRTIPSTYVRVGAKASLTAYAYMHKSQIFGSAYIYTAVLCAG